MINIFIAYARKDREMLDELRKQFNPLEIAGKIKVWYDGEIMPGEKWDEKIQKELYAAEIVLLLVSPDSIASKYFYESEVQKAILHHEQGKTRVIPVILRPCLWQETPIGNLQALPKDGKPVILWSPIDSGYYNVIENVNRLLQDILWEKQTIINPEFASAAKGIIHLIDSDEKKVEFEGELIGGRANGYGLARSFGDNAYEYRGKYVNNLRQDKNAVIKWASGQMYEGEFKEDRRTGKGKIRNV